MLTAAERLQDLLDLEGVAISVYAAACRTAQDEWVAEALLDLYNAHLEAEHALVECLRSVTRAVGRPRRASRYTHAIDTAPNRMAGLKSLERALLTAYEHEAHEGGLPLSVQKLLRWRLIPTCRARIASLDQVQMSAVDGPDG